MSGEHHIQKAYESILSHDFEKAIEYFKLAVRQDPDNARHHYRLSVTYARSSKLAKALEHAETACRLDGEQEEYQLHLRMLRSKMNVQRAEQMMDTMDDGAEKALALLKEAVKLDPLSIEANLLLSIAYKKLNDVPNALQAAQEALKLDPNHEGARQLWHQIQANRS